MSPQKTDLKYIWDMLDAAISVQEFVANRYYHDFLEDKMLRSAVERQIYIIGEAANRVSQHTIDDHPEIPWRPIIAQRNILAHEYGDVSYELLWKVASERIPELIEYLKPLVPLLPNQ